MSKSFTAAAVLQLVEAGRVDLDASVQTYLVAALGGFALAVLVLRTVQLSRLSAWQRRRGRRSPWSALPGIVWLLLPAGLLAAVPALVRAAAGRTFTFWQLCLAMPDVIIALSSADRVRRAPAACTCGAGIARSPTGVRQARAGRMPDYRTDGDGCHEH